MHRHALVVATTLVACAPAQKPVAERAAAPAVRTATVVPTASAPAVPAPVSSSSPSAALDEAALEARRAEELAWATARFPEIADYPSSEKLWTMNEALLSWAAPGQAITVFDRACSPALVTRSDEELRGSLTRDVTRTAGSITVSYDEIEIGIRMYEFGCSSVEYERDGTGKWVVVSSQGLGCASMIGRALSQVTNDAAWYEAVMVRLSLDCSRLVSEETPCADGKTKVCERCEEWKVGRHSLESNVGFSRHPSVRRVSLPPGNGCDSPCVVHAPPSDVQRANEALRWQEFLYTWGLDEHPLVFRTKAACRAYRKIHRFTADELEAWRAGNPRPPELPLPSLEED